MPPMTSTDITITQGAVTVPAEAMELDEHVARWIAFAQVSERTRITYERAIRRFLDWIRDRGISRPTREHVLRYAGALADGEREDVEGGNPLKPHRPSTCRLNLCAVRLFFAWLDTEGIHPNIAVRIRDTRGRSEPGIQKEHLTSSQAARMLAAVSQDDVAGRRNHAMLLLMVTTGLRTLEVARANINDIQTAGDRRVMRIWGKGHASKDAIVVIPPSVDAAIGDYLTTRCPASDDEPLFAAAGPRRGEGGRLTTRTISRIAKEAMKAIGINDDRHTAHSLRHTAATLALSAGKSLEEVRMAMRHRSISTTMIYSHHLAAAENTASAAVADLITKSGAGEGHREGAEKKTQDFAGRRAQKAFGRPARPEAADLRRHGHLRGHRQAQDPHGKARLGVPCGDDRGSVAEGGGGRPGRSLAASRSRGIRPPGNAHGAGATADAPGRVGAQGRRGGKR